MYDIFTFAVSVRKTKYDTFLGWFYQLSCILDKFGFIFHLGEDKKATVMAEIATNA